MEKIREEAIQPGSFKIPNQADYDRKILKLKAGGLKNLQLVLGIILTRVWSSLFF